MSIEESYNIWARKYDTNDNRTRDLDRQSTEGIRECFDKGSGEDIPRLISFVFRK